MLKRSLLHFFFYFELLRQGLDDAANARPILTPSEPVYSCENETTHFTCSDSQVIVLEWKVKPYTDIDDELSYIPSQLDNIPGQVTRNNTYNSLFSNLESFSRIDENFANVTISLTVINSGAVNDANVTCTALEGQKKREASSTIYFSDVPSFKQSSITYRKKWGNFTAILELRDMFDGGGVPIDHYIIQLDNGTQLATPDPTHSFDIMYNTTLSVNISAHNCGGYSDPFSLDIECCREDPKITTTSRINVPKTTIEMSTVTVNEHTIKPTLTLSTSTPSAIPTGVTIAIGVFLLIVSGLLIFTSAYIIYTKQKIWRCTNQSQQEMKCGVVGNPAYDVVHVQGSVGDRLGTAYNMDNNPLYEMRIMSNERHSHKTVTPDCPHVYEHVDTQCDFR